MNESSSTSTFASSCEVLHAHMTDSEKELLAVMLKAPLGESTEEELFKMNKGWINVFYSERLSYRQFLIEFSERLGLVLNESATVDAIEKKLLTKSFDRHLQSLPEEERITLLDTIKAEENRAGRVLKATGPSAAIAGAQLAGFGLYTAASSTLAALGSAMGVSFAFSAYTTLSSVLAFTIGPVGMIAAGAYGVYKFWDKIAGDTEKLDKVLLAIAATRQSVQYGIAHEIISTSA